ncbi:hypothetical protein [Amycolatopsis sp. 195334CR]|uniref:hypothetical protein n=1 Tax=Amycolatopsis sp. 195334CR TaxID=2814588 RepID=UPI001A8CCC1F|nr:hypothetical protein [Amycolatopsis sp. 195334CR]MBN6036676.1 hypothetical protein [Amycolatopsis sp. 195334CR]
MSVSRKDDRHNEDLVNEIADSFTKAVRAKQAESGGDQPKPAFVITGDQRDQDRKRRSR